MTDNKKYSIIFLPEAGIIQYLRTMGVLGEALKKDGYDVYLVDCQGIIPHCSCVSMYMSDKKYKEINRQELCNICKDCQKQTIDFFDFKTINLKDYVEQSFIDEITNLVNNTLSSELINFTYNNINFGKIVLYSFVLDTKVLYFENLNEEQTEILRKSLLQSIIVHECMSNILNEIKPDNVFAFNPYSQCSIVRLLCQENNIKFKYVSNQHLEGANFALPFIEKNTCDNYFENQRWLKCFSDVTVSPKIVEDFFNDIKFRLYGSDSHIFSTSKKDTQLIIDELNLDVNKKIVGVFTSSYDEFVGFFNMLESVNEKYDCVKYIFKNQIEWLECLKDIADKNRDIQFVIKIHPREGRGIQSQHLKILKETLKESDNFKVIWPDNKISSYDLMEIIDLALTSWSTIGLEIQRLATPVMAYTLNLTYPNEGLVTIPKDKNEYTDKFFEILNSKLCFEDIRKAVNFFCYSSLCRNIDMREDLSKNVASFDDFKHISEKFVKPIVNIFEDKYTTFEYNSEEIKNHNYSNTEEKEAIKYGIRKIIDKFYFPTQITKKDFKFRLKRLYIKITTGKKIHFVPQEIYNDYELKYSEDISKINDYINETKGNKNIRYIVKDGIYSIFVINGQQYKRASKMVSNLARIHCEK